MAPMAAVFNGFKSLLFLSTLALLFSVQGAFEGISCESLDANSCAFAVSSSATRCVLEKQAGRGLLQKEERFSCRSSEIEAEESLRDWVETDECVEACGLTRNTLGISSDSLLEPRFTQKLCSHSCYQGCPNIVDLYINLAAGEGLFLPSICQAQERSDARRVMAEIRSTGIAPAGPESGSLASAPTSQYLVASGPAMAPL